jgi:chondroitin AC lyase
VFPCWDWQKVPGTTAEQVKDMDTIEPHAVGVLGKTEFVGGASDGTYGACAMDLRRGLLGARKAWFFFDTGYVCLGAGISDAGNAPVLTAVNQELLKGEVFASGSETPLAEGSHALPGVRWVYHDHAGYVFPKAAKVVLCNTNQTGRWSDIGSGSNKPITLPVFSLWIDHGSECVDATYEYLVMPNITLKDLKQRAGEPDMGILTNAPGLQAAWSKTEQLVEIVFWKAGRLKTPVGAIAADHPCILLARRVSGGVRITVSNPENKPGMVGVSVGGRKANVVLPGGALAGSSVSQKFEGLP